MRIPSPTIWLCSALLVSANNVTFDTGSFQGFNNTAVFLYSDINNSSDGLMFVWSPSQHEGGPTVSSLTLAQVNGTAIAVVENGQQSSSSEDIDVDFLGGSLTLPLPFLQNNLTLYENTTVLYFQLQWSYYQHTGANQPRDDDWTYSYSPAWGVVSDETAAFSSLLALDPALASPDEAYQNEGATPAAGQPAATGATASPGAEASSTSSSASSGATTTSTVPAAASSKNKGLSPGAIAGAVVGGVVFLGLVFLAIGWFLCLRKRRSQRRTGVNGNHAHSRDVHTIRDLMAEKEAHAIMETAPDTPYSECATAAADDGGGQHAMQRQHLPLQIHSSISLSRLRESGVDPADLDRNASHRHGSGIGTAITTAGAVPSEDRRNDSEDDADEREPTTSMLGSSSPVHHRRSSSQRERSFTPSYTDRPPTDYAQHHHVVDGADLVQQEQSNSSNTTNNNNPQANNNPSNNLPREGPGRKTADQEEPERPPLTLSTGVSDATTTTPTTTTDNKGNDSAHSSVEFRPTGFTSRDEGRSTTPSGISGRYAHLVEEGMTDEEIRRLEEEERALDEAIEQATSNTGGRPTPR